MIGRCLVYLEKRPPTSSGPVTSSCRLYVAVSLFVLYARQFQHWDLTVWSVAAIWCIGGFVFRLWFLMVRVFAVSEHPGSPKVPDRL